MARNKVYMVSEDYALVERFKAFCNSQGVEFKTYTQNEWNSQMQGMESTLTYGTTGSMDKASNVIPFPKMTSNNSANGKVQTINELEGVAIENAIFEFNGNLTEAAKALGIGRATLYRKVKQYNIDPSQARRKKAA